MKIYDPIPPHVNEYARVVVDCAVRVHCELGPGLLEPIYEACLAYELETRGIPFGRQIWVPLVYQGKRFRKGLRLDLWINRCLIVEVKAKETILPVHHAQLLTTLN